MEPGDTLSAGDLPVPKEVRLLTAPEEVVAVVVAPRRTAEGTAEDEEAAEEAPAEPTPES